MTDRTLTINASEIADASDGRTTDKSSRNCFLFIFVLVYARGQLPTAVVVVVH